ncbi:unnamed protein product [Prunus brigantina]
MPSGVLNFKTPLQVLAQHRPLPSILVLTPRSFICVAFVYLHKNQRSKLDPCPLRCVFLGYATHQKGYRCYHPYTRQTYVTLDVTFMESEMLFYDPTSNSTLQEEIHSEELNWSSLENEDIHLCTKIALSQETITIDRPKSSTCECFLPNNDRSPNAKLFLIRVILLQKTHNNKMKTPPLTQQYQQTNLLRISLSRLVHLEDKSVGYQLPFMQNRGKPPNRYSPDIGKTSKYPIANHVSTEKLFEPLKAFVHQLSAIRIPTKVFEALKAPK